MSYLGDFLFPPRRANSPVRMLSGGERNRLLLARLFARPANVLVLDEPTNDLDIETLELLEAALQDYGGTILLVSHDRAFLDNVVTQTLAAQGDGTWKEYAGATATTSASAARSNVHRGASRSSARLLPRTVRKQSSRTRKRASCSAAARSRRWKPSRKCSRPHARPGLLPTAARDPARRPGAQRGDRNAVMQKLERWHASRSFPLGPRRSKRSHHRMPVRAESSCTTTPSTGRPRPPTGARSSMRWCLHARLPARPDARGLEVVPLK